MPYGTGFITIAPADDNSDQGWQTIITARHVLDRIPTDTVYVRLNTHSGEAQVIELSKKNWLPHPNPRVDLSVCPTYIPKGQFDILHLPLDRHVLMPEVIRAENIGIGDEVHISGMFISRIGEKKNIPIIRIGTIAAMADEPIDTEYGRHDAFLIEVRSIDGLSGSPVCVHVDVSEVMPDDPEISPVQGGTYRLMGMVLGYNQINYPLDSISIVEEGNGHSASRSASARKLDTLNTGIAVVLPVWKIIEAVNQPALIAKRKKELRPFNRDRGRRFVPTSAGARELEPAVATDEDPRHEISSGC